MDWNKEWWVVFVTRHRCERSGMRPQMFSKWGMTTNTRSKPHGGMLVVVCNQHKEIRRNWYILAMNVQNVSNHFKLSNNCRQIMNRLFEKDNSKKCEILSSTTATNLHNFVYCTRISAKKSVSTSWKLRIKISYHHAPCLHLEFVLTRCRFPLSWLA